MEATERTNDNYGSSRFEQSHMDAIVATFRGLDKIVYDYLTENTLITPMGLRQSCMEVMSSGRDFAGLMLSQGFIKQDMLVQLSLKIDPSELSGKELIEPSIPASLLIKYKIMISAITDTHIYLSTLQNRRLAKIALSKIFPYHRFHFTPAKPKRVLSYLEKVDRYSRVQGTLLEVMIRKAIREKISDIHVYPTQNGYNVKVRYLGQLYVERVGDIDEYLNIVTVAKTSSGLDPADRRTPQDGQFRIDYNGRGVDLRVATCPTIGGKESLVIRILDPENSQVHFNELGITQSGEIVKALQSPNGVVLVCGVTGSGKSTTITSAQRWVLDRFSQSINTIEDPVENELSDVKQTQVDHRSGLTFAKVLRSILRQDPDVVVLGEIRDEETAQITFRAADTGHLLLGTLHVKDVRGVISRLLDLKVEKEKILEQLRGVLVQKLIRVTCQHCHGEGCAECFEKGYVRRTVVSEAVYFKDRNDVKKLLDYDSPKWWNSIIEDAYAKYRNGETDRKEMIRSFGPEFEEIEDHEAKRNLDDVLTGRLSPAEFEKLFPAHISLLTSRSQENK